MLCLGYVHIKHGLCVTTTSIVHKNVKPSAALGDGFDCLGDRVCAQDIKPENGDCAEARKDLRDLGRVPGCCEDMMTPLGKSKGQSITDASG